MSLVRFTICCDWPGCTALTEIQNYPAALRDCRWEFRDEPSTGLHLCPAHRFQTWTELAEAIDRANGHD